MKSLKTTRKKYADQYLSQQVSLLHKNHTKKYQKFDYVNIILKLLEIRTTHRTQNQNKTRHVKYPLIAILPYIPVIKGTHT